MFFRVWMEVQQTMAIMEVGEDRRGLMAKRIIEEEEEAEEGVILDTGHTSERTYFAP